MPYPHIPKPTAIFQAYAFWGRPLLFAITAFTGGYPARCLVPHRLAGLSLRSRQPHSLPGQRVCCFLFVLKLASWKSCQMPCRRGVRVLGEVRVPSRGSAAAWGETGDGTRSAVVLEQTEMNMGTCKIPPHHSSAIEFPWETSVNGVLYLCVCKAFAYPFEKTLRMRYSFIFQ